jgi:hypothetical protein
MVDGVIPSLRTFSSDIDYLRDCVNCVKRLVYVHRGPGETVASHLRQKLRRVPAQDCQIVMQIAEDRFVALSGRRAGRINLHIRQLYAFAMRHYPDMPAESQKKNLVAKREVPADPAVLRRFANLVVRLGFKSAEIELL